ncbi:MAG TPA: hypothetical protein VKV02_05795, partial [Acidobacteriaceae bacterium]|nr:hypothetical protein [Acidobacteriaceae bacterium]
ATLLATAIVSSTPALASPNRTLLKDSRMMSLHHHVQDGSSTDLCAYLVAIVIVEVVEVLL